MNKLLPIFLFVVFVSSQSLWAQSAYVENYGEIKAVPAENYFELYGELNAKNAQEAYENFVGEFIDIDPLDIGTLSGDDKDKLYEARLKMLATEVQLPYNAAVRSYIDRYSKKNAVMENVLGRAKYYFPIFEKALYEYGLPMELKMLPVIESALLPVARSHAAAVGLWQFILSTGKHYGLEVNSFVDERMDPVKSTDAACRFLMDLYKIYGDWTLVIAAYNCGPGNVNKAMKRAGTVGSYWDIWDYLPRETRGYVPAFIGASYGYTFYKANSLEPKEIDNPISVDTLLVSRMVHFDQIATTIPITKEELRALNPQYRIDIIPAVERKFTLVLPTDRIADFIDSEADIYGKDTTYLKKYIQIDNLSEKKALELAERYPSYASGKKTTYKVKSGDTLGAIAIKYGVTVANIKKWNGLRSTNIRIGQRLTIYPR